jgi:spore maturation protein SpmA
MQQKPSAINIIWLGMILIATAVAAYTGRMDEVTKASFESAKSAVTLAIGLIGPMALWLGIMKVAEAGGMMQVLARWVRPLMVRLFPDVPAEHPAMSAMIMNMAANMLGLGNAATPMGIKAMQELDRLTPEKGTASNAMCLFLAINTSSVTLLPLGVITVRAAANAASPAAILVPSLITTTCSTLVAVIAAKMLARRQESRMIGFEPELEMVDEDPPAEQPSELSPPRKSGRIFVWLLITAFAVAVLYRLLEIPAAASATEMFNAVSNWLIPVLICFFLVYGYLKGVRIYETMTEGAKDGFITAIKIIPFMVAIFVAIGMFRASGAMELLIRFFSPVTGRLGMPAEALAMALMRPLSGSGAFGIMSEIVNRAPDSFLSFLVSTMQGSTETTFYVLAVYFGAIGIQRTRHALPAALCADVAGMAAAVIVCNLWF